MGKSRFAGSNDCHAPDQQSTNLQLLHSKNVIPIWSGSYRSAVLLVISLHGMDKATLWAATSIAYCPSKFCSRISGRCDCPEHCFSRMGREIMNCSFSVLQIQPMGPSLESPAPNHCPTYLVLTKNQAGRVGLEPASFPLVM